LKLGSRAVRFHHRAGASPISLPHQYNSRPIPGSHPHPCREGRKDLPRRPDAADPGRRLYRALLGARQTGWHDRLLNPTGRMRIHRLLGEGALHQPPPVQHRLRLLRRRGHHITAASRPRPKPDRQLPVVAPHPLLSLRSRPRGIDDVGPDHDVHRRRTGQCHNVRHPHLRPTRRGRCRRQSRNRLTERFLIRSRQGHGDHKRVVLLPTSQRLAVGACADRVESSSLGKIDIVQPGRPERPERSAAVRLRATIR
jgi:hypothetical protein